MTAAVRVAGVTKRFRDVGAPRTWKDALVARRRLEPIEALRGVDLEIEPGAAVGIVGANGAGKSTLLRVIAGVLSPDAGTVALSGEVGSLLELGAGFHPDLTGRESAVLSGVIAGHSRREARRRVDWVCDFAGLDRFIDRPLRTYSSGMQARLAFAIATETQREILLVDEVLAVGDVAFQQRCIGRLRDFQRAGTTLVVVSHEAELVRMLCSRAVWLDAGEVVDDGSADEVLDSYLVERRPAPTALLGASTGPLGEIRLLDEAGAPCRVVHAGGGVAVSIRLAALDEPAQLAVRVMRDDGLMCVDTSTPIPPGQAGAVLAIDRLDLAPGRYRVDVALHDRSWRATLDQRREAATLRILGTASASAALAPPARWTVGPAAPVPEAPHRRSGRHPAP